MNVLPIYTNRVAGSLRDLPAAPFWVASALLLTLLLVPQARAQLTEETILTTPVAGELARLGNSIAISSNGEYAVVGAADEEVEGEPVAGAAYIFHRSGSSWVLQARLIASEPGNVDYFGRSVAISPAGDYAAVGAIGDDAEDNVDPTEPFPGNNAGAVFIFRRDGSTWSEQARLFASDPQADDLLGTSVAISSGGEHVLAGAVYEGVSDLESSTGAAYVFRRNGSSWSQQAKLTAPEADAVKGFGISVTIDLGGVYAIVGAPGNPAVPGDNEPGAAYVFRRDGSTWSQQAKLAVSDADAGNDFGNSVAISSSGDYGVIGASSDVPFPGTDVELTGAAYVFGRSGSSWSQQAELIVGDATVGRSVAISPDGDYALVGASKADGPGAAYVFGRSGSSWSQQAELVAADGDLRGPVAIGSAGRYAIVVGDTDIDGESVGAAFVYQPVQQDRPTITGVEPNPVVGSDADQPLTVRGSGFAESAFVILDDTEDDQPPFENPDKTTFVSSTELIRQATVTGNAATWTAVVENPDGQRSEPFTFEVVAPLDVPLPPRLRLSTASLERGGTLTVTGTEFTPGGMVTLYVDGPGGFTTTTETRTASSSGEVSYTFSTSSDGPSGTYVVSARDEATGTSAPSLHFRVTAPPPPAELVVVTPVEGETVSQGDRVTVEWLDDIHLSTPYPQEGARRGYRYRIEYTSDGGGTWTSAGVEEGFALVSTTASFSYGFVPAGTGEGYRVRVIDFYRPERRVESGTFRVVASVADLRLDLVRDYSLDRRFVTTASLQGVAADGVARLYLRLENRSPKTIQRVAVRLSDGVSSGTGALGKVMRATVTDRYSDEANDASSTVADDDRPGLGAYWFWYVAPDDFTRFAQGDRNRPARTVTAQFEVTFTDGTRQSVERDLRIIRPPLMLVHGLGGDEHTWDRFGSGGKLFVEDERFLVRKAVNLEKAAAFRWNARYLLGGFEDQGTYYRGSFLNLLIDMQRRGYAAAQVYYVCHSMGGSVVRSAAASPDFKTQANYGQGYVDRLITLGTPHLGSPLADLTEQATQAVNDFVLSGCSVLDFFLNYKECYAKLGVAGLREYVLNRQNDPAFLPGSFVWVQADEGQTVFTFRPALADLSVAGGVRFSETPLPSHLIAGDLVPGSQSLPGVPSEAWQAMGALKSLIEFWDRMLDQPAALSALGIDVADVKALKGINNDAERVVKALDLALRAYASTGFIVDSDGIVSVESQLAGLTGGPRTSTVDRIIHTGPSWIPFADAITENARVGTLVDDLLDTPVGSGAFGPIPASGGAGGRALVAQAAPPQASLQVAPLNARASASRAVSEVERPELDLLSPQPTTEVVAGDPLLVRAALGDTVGLIYAKAYFQGASLTSTEKEYVYDFTFETSGTAVDSQLVEVVAMYEREGGLVTVGETAMLHVVPSGPTQMLDVSPRLMRLHEDQAKAPAIEAIFEAHLAEISPASAAVSVTVLDPGVVRFNSDLGTFTGVGTGETSAIVAYRGQTDTLYFAVGEEELDADGLQTLDVRLLLEGPYAGGSMATALQADGFLPANQPYSAAPWNYDGDEAADLTSIPDVVDWVLLELRTAPDAAPAARRAALLLSDGSVVDLDGASPVAFADLPPGAYRVVVRHRNHLAVMSAEPVSFDGGSAAYDFTAALSQAYSSGAPALVDLGGGDWGLVAGDADGDGRVAAPDNVAWLGANGSAPGYLGADLDLSGRIGAPDNVEWLGANGSVTQVPQP